jgi:type IV pilus assembly protein PilC
MANYSYTARNAKGGLVTGELEGESIKLVQKALRAQGLFPLKVATQFMSLKLEDLRIQQKVSIKELVSFTRQFKVMFKAGLPIRKIFETLLRQTSHPELKKALKVIQVDVNQGVSMSKAFSKHPKIFNSLYVNMLAVGEVGGVLDTVLTALSDMLLDEYRIISKVKAATIYPKIVLVVLVLVFIVMMMFVVPAFQDFYAGQKAELPLPTRIIIVASDLTLHYWYVGFAAFAGLYLFWKQFVRMKMGQFILAYFQFRLPVFGILNKLVANARFSNLISSLYDSGLPISRALDIVADTMGNALFAKEVKRVKLQMDQGKNMSAAMATSSYFTPMVIETTGIGEKTGALGEVLKSTAEFYNEEVDGMLKNLTTLIEPLLLLVIFAMVGLLAFAIFMPIWNLSKVVLPG